ncbi:MAG TPA: AmmeMemoRadiSam system radical SAM enzyme [Firmicutes bacterium]|nr:AmmeMemoRadiSam system radical SAM enzyme [Bacillota bacterium]
MKLALYAEPLSDDKVQCHLCPHGCRISPGQSGICRVRVNKEGTLYAANYAQVSSLALDPIEKKPLYHFYPGKDILSLGTVGCNLKCSFCQNYGISQEDAHTRKLGPEQAVRLAKEQGPSCIGLAYTYSEPLMWYEYVLDTARQAKAAGLKNVLVTNGFIQPEPFKELLPFIDAMNIDIKSFQEDYYRRICAGKLAPVLETVENAVAAGCHVEITTLVVPGLNDSPAEIKALAGWIAELSPTIPLHLSRYFPQYKMDLPPTPLQTLKQALNISREKLNYVYIGNAAADGGRDTYCPSCGAILIRRSSLGIQVMGCTEDGTCQHCQTKTNLII